MTTTAFLAKIAAQRDELKKLRAQIAEANKILNQYCVGCSRFKESKCVLKRPRSCEILRIRLTLAGDEMQK